MEKKGKKSVKNKFRYMHIEYLWLSFQRCYLFREVMQAMSNTVQIISIFLLKVMNVCRYKTLFVAFWGAGGLFSQLHELIVISFRR